MIGLVRDAVAAVFGALLIATGTALAAHRRYRARREAETPRTG